MPDNLTIPHDKLLEDARKFRRIGKLLQALGQQDEDYRMVDWLYEKANEYQDAAGGMSSADARAYDRNTTNDYIKKEPT